MPIEKESKAGLLGWLAFSTSLVIQVIAATWVIAKMDAAITDLKVQVAQIVQVQTTQATQLNTNTLGIEILKQQCCVSTSKPRP